MMNRTVFALVMAIAFFTGCESGPELQQYGGVGSIQRFDPAMDELIDPKVIPEKLSSGFEWAEGPVWIKRGEAEGLLFTDIPKNRVVLWMEGQSASTLIYPAGYTGEIRRGGELGANGLAFDAAGNILLCQHGDRRIAMLRRSPTFSALRNVKFETVVDRYEGKRFNSPNDLCVKSNGDIYFTDPPYGLERGMDDPKKELDFQGVYRFSKDGNLTLLTKELSRPNGIAFSPDEKTLYVANSDPKRAIWMAYPVNSDGSIGTGKVFYDATPMVSEGFKGLPDGLKVDVKGNLWATGPGGVLIFSPSGKRLGLIETTQKTANCAFGNDGSVLYMTADGILCRIRTLTKGIGFPE